MLLANYISCYKHEDACHGVFCEHLFYIVATSDGRFCKAGGNRIIVLLCVSTRYDYTTVNPNGNPNFIQRAGICLLNALACQVEGQQKLLVGDFGAMEKMLGIIQNRLRSSK